MRLNGLMLNVLFGAQFPLCTEIDHLLALRGLLFLYRSNRQRRGEPVSEELNEAIREVTDRLEALGVNLDSRPQAPGELFEHYLRWVSYNWKWLKKFAA